MARWPTRERLPVTLARPAAVTLVVIAVGIAAVTTAVTPRTTELRDFLAHPTGGNVRLVSWHNAARQAVYDPVADVTYVLPGACLEYADPNYTARCALSFRGDQRATAAAYDEYRAVRVVATGSDIAWRNVDPPLSFQTYLPSVVQVRNVTMPLAIESEAVPVGLALAAASCLGLAAVVMARPTRRGLVGALPAVAVGTWIGWGLLYAVELGALVWMILLVPVVLLALGFLAARGYRSREARERKGPISWVAWAAAGLVAIVAAWLGGIWYA